MTVGSFPLFHTWFNCSRILRWLLRWTNWKPNRGPSPWIGWGIRSEREFVSWKPLGNCGRWRGVVKLSICSCIHICFFVAPACRKLRFLIKLFQGTSNRQGYGRFDHKKSRMLNVRWAPVAHTAGVRLENILQVSWLYMYILSWIYARAKILKKKINLMMWFESHPNCFFCNWWSL